MSEICEAKEIIKPATGGSCGKRQIGWLNNNYKKVKLEKQVIEHINCF